MISYSATIKRFLPFFTFTFTILLSLNAQNNSPGQIINETLTIEKINIAVEINGVLDESIWMKVPDASNFWQYFPVDTTKASNKTEVWMAYDEKYLYIAAKLYDNNDGNYVSKSLKRDYSGDNGDGFTVVIDPFQDKTNGFFFSVNPYEVQR